jgi:signal transduction histidine kinase
MITRFFGSSVRRKLMLIMAIAILSALFVNGVALLVYDLDRYNASWIADLQSQAEVVGRASIPALKFDDPRAADGNLRLLSIGPNILAAAIYDAEGHRFADFRAGPSDVDIPTQPAFTGHRISGSRIVLFQPITENGRMIGTIFLAARYQLADRIIGYLAISGSVTLLSLVTALLLSLWFQRSFTEPIISIAEVARRIMATRDYSLRAPATTADEVGYLAGSFNSMLEEVTRGSEALKQADRRKDEFLATLAHELRNPLSPLRNGLDILRMMRNSEQAGAAHAIERAEAMMDRQIQQISRLVDDLLDVSRITTGKVLLKRERTELAPLVRGALDTVAELVRLREHNLAVTMPTERVELDADPARLAQVLINLLNNAAKYTKQGGQIELNLATVGHDLIITVSDNGIGLTPEAQRYIFEMFRQVDTSLEREQAGLGVGLTLTQTLVQLHGGTIEIFSEGLERGTRFTVRLPIVIIAEPNP